MTWEPPPAPDLAALAHTGWREWELDQPKTVAFDTETNGFEFRHRAFGASLAWVHDDALTGKKEVRGHWFDFTVPGSVDAVRAIIGAAEAVVAHNAKFDLRMLWHEGIYLAGHTALHDTEAMAHLDDEHRRKGLKDLAVSVLGFDDTIMVPAKRKNPETGEQEEYEKPVPRSKYEIDKARAWAKKHYGLDSIDDVGYDLLPRGTLVPYAVLDAVWTYQLAGKLMPRVLMYEDLRALYDQEIQLTRGAMLELEIAGMGVDLGYLEREIRAYRTKVAQHELDIEQIVGKPVRSGKIPPKERADYFNPASNDEIRAYFEARGETRECYDAEQLRLMTNQPLAVKLLEYRADKKILDTYLLALVRDTDEDGIFHPSLRQHGTVTGRTSAGAERGD